MPRAKVIVCEKSGDWAASFRAALPDLAPRLHETRSLPECEQELSRHPASVVLVEAAPGRLAPLTAWLAQLERKFPDARAIALGARPLRLWEEALREAGAVWAAFSPRNLAPAGRLIRRRLARADEVEDDGPPLERILERLPWKRWATGRLSPDALTHSSLETPPRDL